MSGAPRTSTSPTQFSTSQQQLSPLRPNVSPSRSIATPPLPSASPPLLDSPSPPTVSSLPRVSCANNNTTPPDTRDNSCQEPPVKMRKLNDSSEDGDGDSCPVCLEPWGNSGNHRLVSLKCGHLFGSQCVERWLRASSPRKRACPTCKSRAAIKDLRPIYARRLIAVDTAELTALQQKLDILQAEKNRMELELTQSRLAHRGCAEQLEALLRNGAPPAPAPPPAPPRRVWRFALEKNLEISREGGCRVMAYNSRSYELYVSQQSTCSLFPGWGVRKVSCMSFNCGQFQLLHAKAIRDATYSPSRDLLLTAGLDGCARLSSPGVVAHSIQTGSPLWACAWDAHSDHYLYTGGVGGAVLQYDLRNVSAPSARLATAGPTTPVIALRSTEPGLLSCRLNSCALWQRDADAAGWTERPLPAEGTFTSMSYDEENGRALLACRPRAGEPGRLVVCRLQNNGSYIREKSFSHTTCATVMCRAAWVSAGGTRWAAAYAERALQLYDVTGTQHATLPCSEPALDMLGISLSGDTLLAALSQSRLRVYKARAVD